MAKNSAAIALVGALLSVAPAQAAIVTQTFTFEGSDFTRDFGDGSVAPIDAAFVSGSVTFDTSLDYTGATAGLTFSSNLPYTAQFGYSSASDIFTLATHAGPGSCGNPADSFCAFFGNFAASSTPLPFYFEQSTSTVAYYTARTITAGVAAVPEPASWALMIVGAGAVGTALRRRRAVRIAYS